MTATAAIVLAGGRSTRMGRPKADLEWHGSTLVRRAAGIVRRAVDGPVVVVRAKDQSLPPLPGPIEITEDAREGRGPLEAIAAGLRAIGDRAEVVYVTGVDAPLLHPAFVRRVIELLGSGDDIAIPRAQGFAQPLAAAYRVTVAAPLAAVLREGAGLGTRALLERCRLREIDEAALLADPAVAGFDPALESLLNVNARDQYEAARARPAPRVAVVLDDEGETREVRAAALGAAAREAGLALGPGVRASINDAVADDPQDPLVAGDVVTLGRGRSSIF